MRHLLATILVVVCNLAGLARDTPKAEIFAGYSYGNYELFSTPSTVLSSSIASSTISISNTPSARSGLSGWNGSAAVTLSRWFSFVTDFSGYYSGSSASVTTIETLSLCASCGTQVSASVSTLMRPKIHNFLFGPQFSHRGGKIRPFVQFLVGGEHVDMTRMDRTTISSGILPPSHFVESGHIAETGFAMALGGGVDVSIKRNLAWRLQADYLTSQAGLAQNHVRVSTGLVWQLGN
jgi:hypothetical protein